MKYFHNHRERSGRVLASRSQVRALPGHCVVVLEQDAFILAKPQYWFNPGRKTRPYITEILLIGRKESNQTNFHNHWALNC